MPEMKRHRWQVLTHFSQTAPMARTAAGFFVRGNAARIAAQVSVVDLPGHEHSPGTIAAKGQQQSQGGSKA